MGTDCMPIMHARYRHSKGSGIEGIAALLAADAAVKPTTVVRPLYRPSANADFSPHSHGKHPCALSNGAPCHARCARLAACSHIAQPVPAASIALPAKTIAIEPTHRLPQPPLSVVTCEFVLRGVRAAIEQHAVPTRHWLQRPAVASVPQAQLAAGACTITAPMPRKPPTPLLH